MSKYLASLLVLIPTLLWGSFYLKEFGKLVEKMSSEWERAYGLVEQFNRLDPQHQQQALHLLDEAVHCCERAVGQCDYILHKIGKKSKEEKKEWKQQRLQIEQYKHQLQVQIGVFQTIKSSAIVFGQVRDLVQQGLQRAGESIASVESLEKPLYNHESVINVFKESIELLEQAIQIEREALVLLGPFQDESSKTTLNGIITQFQTALDDYREQVRVLEAPADIE